MLGVKNRPQGTFDADLEFKDAGLIAASAAATVDGDAQIIDLGTGHVRGKMIVDVSAIDTGDTDEIYDIVVQLSSDSDFGTDTNIVEAAQLSLGDKGAKRTDCNADDSTGRYKLYFDNEHDGTFYQYARIYTVVAGTVGTGINYAAYCVPVE